MTPKDKTKAMRKKVRELMAEFNVLNNEILASINSNSSLEINDPTDRLRFYLLDEVAKGFSHTSSSLHRIWDTYPPEPSPLEYQTNWRGDSDGTVGVD